MKTSPYFFAFMYSNIFSEKTAITAEHIAITQSFAVSKKPIVKKIIPTTDIITTDCNVL